MITLRRFIFTGLICLFIALVTILVAWYYIVIIPSFSDSSVGSATSTQQISTLEIETETTMPALEPDTDSAVPQVVKAQNVLTVSDFQPQVLNLRNLPDSQKTVLGTLGIDEDEIIITQEMYICALEALGETRLSEIIAGDTPSIFEASSLFRCY